MFGKGKKRLYKELSTEVAEVCATCRYASSMHSSEALLCSKKGPVSPEYSCKKYEYNLFMKRPQKRRNLELNLNLEDLSID